MLLQVFRQTKKITSVRFVLDSNKWHLVSGQEISTTWQLRIYEQKSCLIVILNLNISHVIHMPNCCSSGPYFKSKKPQSTWWGRQGRFIHNLKPWHVQCQRLHRNNQATTSLYISHRWHKICSINWQYFTESNDRHSIMWWENCWLWTSRKISRSIQEKCRKSSQCRFMNN